MLTKLSRAAIVLALSGLPAFAGDTLDPELVSAGERQFKKCQACHMVGEGAKNRVGPVLSGIVGAPVAAKEDFRYSPAMKAFAETQEAWTPELLDEYLTQPRKVVPKTTMSFVGLRKPEEREAVIAFLMSHSPDFDPEEEVEDASEEMDEVETDAAEDAAEAPEEATAE